MSPMKPKGQGRQGGRSGLTLIELMVVAIIVAILAAAAIPLMAGGKKKAMATEAVAALGTARTSLRTMYAETRDYTQTPSGETLAPMDPLTSIPGVTAAELAGKYFKEGDYSIESISRQTYVLKCAGSTGEVAGVVIRLDQAGNLQTQGI